MDNTIQIKQTVEAIKRIIKYKVCPYDAIENIHYYEHLDSEAVKAKLLYLKSLDIDVYNETVKIVPEKYL